VKGVMVDNIEKVTQRGDKLEDLGERAGQYIALYIHYNCSITLCSLLCKYYYCSQSTWTRTQTCFNELPLDWGVSCGGKMSNCG